MFGEYELALKDKNATLTKDRRSWSKAERICALRCALEDMCHPARPRDEVTVNIDYDRQDAVSVIAMAAAILPMAFAAHVEPVPTPADDAQ